LLLCCLYEAKYVRYISVSQSKVRCYHFCFALVIGRVHILMLENNNHLLLLLWNKDYVVDEDDV